MLSTTLEQPAPCAGPPVARLQRASAFATDLAWGAGAVLFAGLAALTWLFIRSDWGGSPVSDGDSIIAAALVGAAIPAWFTWLAMGAQADGVTRGQRRAGLQLSMTGGGRPAPRVLRLVVHPLSTPVWLWGAALLWLVELPWAPFLLTTIAVTIALMSIISVAIILAKPSARALHDHIAGTRLVSRGAVST